MGSTDDFRVKEGVLVEYRGPGGDVTIPEGVTIIGGTENLRAPEEAYKGDKLFPPM